MTTHSTKSPWRAGPEPFAALPQSQEGLEKYLEERTQDLTELVGRLNGFFESSPAGIFVTTPSGRILRANPALAEICGYDSPEDMLRRIENLGTQFYRNPARRAEFKRLLEMEGEARNFEAEIVCKDGSKRWLSITASRRGGATDPDRVYQGFMTDITERKTAESALAEELLRRRMLIDQARDGIVVLSMDGKLHECNESFARNLGYSLAEARQLYVWDWDGRFTREELSELLKTWAPTQGLLETLHRRKDGTIFPVEISVNRAEWEGEFFSFCLVRDVTHQKRLEKEAEKTHQQLLLASRQAGMAEVATSVLHNVGNVLNSVNTSLTVLKEHTRDAQTEDIARVADLLESHQEDLASFLSGENRSEQLISYLKSLAQHLTASQNSALAELNELAKNIDHIKEIVGMQQNYARIAGATETIQMADLVEDALSLHARALLRHDVEVIREYDPNVPKVTVEKHKVLQILVNLIHNAKYACDAARRTEKRLTVRVIHGGDCVRIAVVDNGIGIPAENLTKIFSHGFTTRAAGHGFGLHSAALAAREMGGVLRVQSDGADRGASFTLEIPFLQQPPTA